MTRLLIVVCVGALWLAGAAPALAQDQVLFLSITDGDGVPVTDLEQDEILVQWDGEDSEIRRLESVEWPVRVTVFIDNSTGGSEAVDDIRVGMRAFLNAMPPGIEVGMLTMSGRPQWITRHTTDKGALLSDVDLVVPDTSGSTYLDGLVEEAERLADDREGEYFPVIVMVAADGPEGSGSQQGKFETAIQRLIDASATVHTRMLSHGNTGALQSQVGSAAAQATRGSFETLGTGSAFRTMLPELGEQIARKHELVSNQYRVIYRPPSSVSATPSISVGTTRRGLRPLPTVDGNVPVQPLR